MKNIIFIATIVSLFNMNSACLAGEVKEESLVKFEKGNNASASQVNNNFSALKNAINDNNERVSNHKVEIDSIKQQLNGFDASTLQKKITQSCGEGQSIRAIDSEGNVTCEIDDVGVATDISGLENEISNLKSFQTEITTGCPLNQSIRAVDDNGKLICEEDNDSTNIPDKLVLGSGSVAGKISIHSADLGKESITFDGNTGNAIQSPFSNGLVKAWAIIGNDGSLVNSYNCTSSSRIATGQFVVDCEPVDNSSNAGRRPKFAIVDGFSNKALVGTVATVSDNADSKSATNVQIYNPIQAAYIDHSFTLIIF